MSQLTRRQVLKSAGLTAGAFAFPRRGAAQTKPGTLISAQTTEATGLDPQLVPALSRSRRSPLTYNQLVRFDPDMTLQPELAESWQISPDGLTWTFKLRQGVKFHDGQEFTSADVKFSFDRLLEKSAAGKSDFNAVDKIEPAGKYAVKFVTKEPFAALVAALGGFWGFIVSEAGVKKHGDLNKAALGTGPFILDDWKVEQQMVFKRNPNYWKKGLPHVDELILRVIPDEANIVAALRTGQVHHAFIEDNKNYNLLKDEKSLTGYRSSRLGYDYLNMSANRGPLGDVRVRQAISWAVDRAQVMRVATAGFGRLTGAVHGAHEAVAAARRAVDEVLQARPGARQEAHGGGWRAERIQREVLGDPDLPHDGVGRAGHRRAAQANRHQHGDRERRVRRVDQALAGPRLST
jgi:ABC-type transport system substrate-binding protein